MLIKSFMGGDVYKNNVTPGVYPKWSRMHLRIWCILRVESMVLVPLTACIAARRLGRLRSGSLVRKSARIFSVLKTRYFTALDLITIDDDVAIQTGAYIQPTRWSGQYFSVGPVHLESGCKIGMRAAISNNVTIGTGTWITPFTPVLADVGLKRGLGGLAGASYRPLHRTAAYGESLRVYSADSGCSRASMC